MDKKNDSCAVIKQIIVCTFVVFAITLGGIVTYSNKLYSGSFKTNSILLANANVESGIEEDFEDEIFDASNSEMQYFKFQPIMALNETFVETSGDQIISKKDITTGASTSLITKVLNTNSYTLNFGKTYLNEKFLSEYVLPQELIEYLSGDKEEEKLENKEVSGEINNEPSGEYLVEVVPEEGAENIVIDDGKPTNYTQVFENVTATAYCLCKKCTGKNPGDRGYGMTASGLKIIPNTGMKVIAVDPKVIPLGTKVYVESLDGREDYGYAVAADTGGAIKNMKIDLYYDSHATCLQWGRRKVRIYILPNEVM